jgi:hypothetical protein
MNEKCAEIPRQKLEKHQIFGVRRSGAHGKSVQLGFWNNGVQLYNKVPGPRPLQIVWTVELQFQRVSGERGKTFSFSCTKIFFWCDDRGNYSS